MKRFVNIGILIISIFFCLSSPNKSFGNCCYGSGECFHYVDVDLYGRAETMWCWNGCAQMILDYWGAYYSQYTIADYAVDGYNTWTWLWGEGTCGFDCDYPSLWRIGVNIILDEYEDLYSACGEFTLYFEDCCNQIRSGRPFIIRWHPPGEPVGHMVVCSSALRIWGREWLGINDPCDADGEFYFGEYDWVCEGGGHEWDCTCCNIQ